MNEGESEGESEGGSEDGSAKGRSPEQTSVHRPNGGGKQACHLRDYPRHPPPSLASDGRQVPLPYCQ